MFNKKTKLFTIIMAMMLTIGTGATVASAAATPETEDLTVTFENSDTLSLSISSNTVDFGQVSGLTSNTSNTFTVTVKSSLPYNLDAMPYDCFKDSSDSSKTIPINKLGMTIDSVFKNFIVEGVPVSLSESSPKTTSLSNQEKSYQLGLTLSSTIGYDKGNYSAPIMITATQF